MCNKIKMEIMNKNPFRKFYDGIINVLLLPVFRAVATVFSHGATHFIFCIIIGIVTFLLLTKDQDKITPHNLDVFVGYLSNYKDEYKEMKLSSETIDNVSIQVILNSNGIKAATNGKYSNGVTVSFDGKTIKRVIHTPEKPKNAFSPATYSTISFLDSIVVAIDSDPAIGKCEVNTSISPVLGYSEAFVDSVTGFVTREKLLIAGNTDLNYHIIKYNTGKVASCIAPRTYSEGKTRHNVTFFSNEIGVQENDPYYYYYISFPKFEFSGDLQITFSVSDLVDKENNSDIHSQNKNLQYNFIYPEPDVIGNGYISYFTQEKKEQLRNNRGVVIQAVDIDAQNRQNRFAFLFSVLVGTGFAFLLDIIIQLIRELRRLQERKAK